MPPNTSSNQPAVDVVIAVHNADRPVGRAVESVLQGGVPGGARGVRISVVCHNIDPVHIRRKLPAESVETLRLLSCQDGIPSPAGPFNLGVASAEADYVSIMGSDDYLEPGALAGWLSLARRFDSDAVIAPQRHASGSKVRTPPVRVGRSLDLDPVRDRLSYRTAPLGLVKLKEIQRLGLAFGAGRRSGEDQEFSAKLWFGGGRIDYARRAGAYVVGADASDRVSSAPRPVEEDLRFALDLVNDPWFESLSVASRRAIVVKLIRVHIFGVVHARSGIEHWAGEDRRELSVAAEALIRAAPRSRDVLSISEARLLAAVRDPRVSESELAARAIRRRSFLSPASLLASRWNDQLAVEAPLRFMAASALL